MKMIQSLILVAGLFVLFNAGIVGNLPAPEDFRSTLELPEPGYTDRERTEMNELFGKIE